jgi:hypothetical protein
MRYIKIPDNIKEHPVCKGCIFRGKDGGCNIDKYHYRPPQGKNCYNEPSGIFVLNVLNTNIKVL